MRLGDARGGGYANTVTKEGWQGFSEHLAQARSDLTDAWNLHPDFPLAPCRMIYCVTRRFRSVNKCASGLTGRWQRN